MKMTMSYELTLAKKGEAIPLALPDGFEILSVMEYAGVPTLYVMFDHDAKCTKNSFFRVIKNRVETVPALDLKFVGTVKIGNYYEYHIFQDFPAVPTDPEPVENIPAKEATA